MQFSNEQLRNSLKEPTKTSKNALNNISDSQVQIEEIASASKLNLLNSSARHGAFINFKSANNSPIAKNKTHLGLSTYGSNQKQNQQLSTHLIWNAKQARNMKNNIKNITVNGGFGGIDDNAVQSQLNLINMSTQNLKATYSKYLDFNLNDTNPIVPPQLTKPSYLNKNFHMRSTSLGANELKMITAANSSANNSSFKIKNSPQSTNKSNQLQQFNFQQASQPQKLPSIFENYLKSNPLNTNTNNTNTDRSINNNSKIVLLDNSSIIDFPQTSKGNMLPPFKDLAMKEAQQKFLQTSLRRQQTKTAIESAHKINIGKLSALENSIINERSEYPMNITDINFRKKKSRPQQQQQQYQQQSTFMDSPGNQLSVFNKSVDDDVESQPQQNKYRWNKLQNLDFLEDENDALQFDVQIPKFDPICLCQNQSPERCMNIHGSIDGMIELINEQFKQVQELNTNVDKEYEYMDTSIKKIVFLRGHNFFDQITQIIKEKNQEIQELKSEVSRLYILKRDNEILTMQVKHYEEDQVILKEKYSESKQQRALIVKMETLAQDMKIRLQAKECQVDSLIQRKNELKQEVQQTKQKFEEVSQQNTKLQEKIEKLETYIKSILAENSNFRQFIEGSIESLENRDRNLVEKGKKLINKGIKLNNKNVLSEQMNQLENDVMEMDVLKYLAEASVDVKKGRDIGALEHQKSIEKSKRSEVQMESEESNEGSNLNQYEKLVYSKKSEAQDAPRIDDEQLEEIKNAFELFDSDGTGQIKPKDMIKTFERLGLHKEKPSIYKLILSMNTVDNNLEGLNFDQFMNLTIQYYSDRYTREGIKHIFELFDEEGLGYITRDTLRKVIFQLGMALNKDELDEIFDKASTDSERKVITYDDFEFFMKKDEIKQ